MRSVLRRLLALLHVQGHGTMLQVGDTAPAFELSDHLGRTVRSSDFAGRTFVLWFYPKADTPG
jgi:peroxiredoxin Q/BCP